MMLGTGDFGIHTFSERAAEGAVPVLLTGVVGIRVGVDAARDRSFFMGLHTYTYT